MVTIRGQFVVNFEGQLAMRRFFGVVTETTDLGVVAEHCPHCDVVKSCLLRAVHQGHYVCYVKVSDPLRESSCLCTDCLKPFPGKPHWSYAAVVPISDARGVELDDLLTKTNPILADRIRFKQQIRELGGDERFAVAYDDVEGLHPGGLRSNLFNNLLHWPTLNEPQREDVKEQIAAMSRAWKFARHLAIGFPTSSGTLTFFTSVMLIGLILIGVIVTRSWMWGGLALAASVVAATVIESNLFRRSVGKWTLQVLIPEAREVNVPLDRFIAVVDDIHATRLTLTEDLWPMRSQLPRIRETLIAEGKLRPAPTPETN